MAKIHGAHLSDLNQCRPAALHRQKERQIDRTTERQTGSIHTNMWTKKRAPPGIEPGFRRIGSDYSPVARPLPAILCEPGHGVDERVVTRGLVCRLRCMNTFIVSEYHTDRQTETEEKHRQPDRQTQT